MKRVCFVKEGGNYSESRLLELIDSATLKSLADEQMIQSTRHGWSLCFVGLIIEKRRLLVALPKYIETACFKEQLEHTRILLAVLRKFGKNCEASHPDARWLSTDISTSNVSAFTVADFLISDFIEHGPYRRVHRRTSQQTHGEIHWQLTLERGSALHSLSGPIYHDPFRHSTLDDPMHLITRIHLAAVHESLVEFGDLLGYASADLIHKLDPVRGALPDPSLIPTLIDKEMRVVFVERYTQVLKAIKSWFSNSGYNPTQQFTVFGTRFFHAVWESACSLVFGNEIANWKAHMPRPVWEHVSGASHEATSLRPDIVRNNPTAFLLLDAKYYDLDFTSETVGGHPGTPDVSKQLLYAKLLRPHTPNPNLLKNAFLFPTESSLPYEVLGKVNIRGVGEEPIAVVKMTASNIFSKYINGQELSDQEIANFATDLDNNANVKTQPSA